MTKRAKRYMQRYLDENNIRAIKGRYTMDFSDKQLDTFLSEGISPFPMMDVLVRALQQEDNSQEFRKYIKDFHKRRMESKASRDPEIEAMLKDINENGN